MDRALKPNQSPRIPPKFALNNLFKYHKMCGVDLQRISENPYKMSLTLLAVTLCMKAKCTTATLKNQ